MRLRVRPWMAVSLMWVAPAALAAIDRLAQPGLRGDRPPSAADLIWASGDWLVYAFLTPIIFWIAGRWPITRPHLARRTALHLGISLVFCAAWAMAGTVLRLSIGFVFNRGDSDAFINAAGDHFWRQVGTETASWIFTTLPFGVVVYLGMAGMAHAIRFFVEARDREVQLARTSAQLADARLGALQAQVNPHFLFNTLNTIAVRARDGDTTGTVAMVEQLSDLLRQTLSRSRGAEVRLEDELAIVHGYLAIEQARFPDRLRPAFRIETGVVDAVVPSFSVQHLVENTVRHGIARQPGAGALTISARREDEQLVVAVEDDGAGIGGDEAPPGHGIANTRERLQVMYGGLASLAIGRAQPRGTVAILRVPYRTREAEGHDGE
jgi:two-component system, LytTR family, sensor kinase